MFNPKKEKQAKRNIGTGCVRKCCLLQIFSVYSQKNTMQKLFNWIGRALSESGNPSSKRLFAFMFVLTTCYAILYKVHRSHELPTYVYYPALGMIALLAGVATVPQIIQLWRGNSAQPSKDEKPTE